MKFTSKQARKVLRLPVNAIAYDINCRLREEHPKLAIEACEGYFGLEAFAAAGHCQLEVSGQLTPQYELDYVGPEEALHKTACQYAFRVHWNGTELNVLQLRWNSGRYSMETYQWILGETSELVWDFYRAVMDHNAEVRDEILVFNGGCFSKDEQLYRDIQSSVLDNLVLPGNLKEELAEDCQSFFDSRALYEQYGVPWKRGYLLMGPPGNGKSHAVKALLNHLKKPCIYVQSFKSEHSTDHSVMRALFKRARVTTPCILVLEDLDSLINDGNRSFFLNELDGFAANHGILAIATTNHPERLDPAILERPSRFDRKYTFGLPEKTERINYLTLWNSRLEKELRVAVQAIEKVAEATEGFSYAYLKELVLSSMMAWMRTPGKHSMEEVMLEVTAPLSQQISQPATEAPSYGDCESFNPFEMMRKMGLR